MWGIPTWSSRRLLLTFRGGSSNIPQGVKEVSQVKAGLDNFDCRSTGGGLRFNIVSKCLDFKPITHFSKGKGVELMQRRQGLTKSMFGNNYRNCHVIIT